MRSDPFVYEGETPDMSKVNGILARVGGEFIAAGSEHLPKPAAGLPSPQSAVVEVPGLGLVRIRYKLSSYQHRRNKFWHWVAEWAGPETTKSPPPSPKAGGGV